LDIVPVAKTKPTQTTSGFLMETNVNNQRSYLFTLRVWQEKLDDQKIEWRGTVRHVLSGETNHFRDWASLIRYLEAALLSDQTEAQP
jgi:hypothetical protein